MAAYHTVLTFLYQRVALLLSSWRHLMLLRKLFFSCHENSSVPNCHGALHTVVELIEQSCAVFWTALMHTTDCYHSIIRLR